MIVQMGIIHLIYSGIVNHANNNARNVLVWRNVLPVRVTIISMINFVMIHANQSTLTICRMIALDLVCHAQNLAKHAYSLEPNV